MCRSQLGAGGKKPHHKIGVGLDPAGAHPGILLADDAQSHAVFGVEGRLFVGAAHDDVLALGEVTDATRVVGESPVLSDLYADKKRQVGEKAAL